MKPKSSVVQIVFSESLLARGTENSLFILLDSFRPYKNSCSNLARMFELTSLSVILDLNDFKAIFVFSSISIASLSMEKIDAYLSILAICPCKSMRRMSNSDNF